jgi:parvulin-like peptidyl-prolyl isomerase
LFVEKVSKMKAGQVAGPLKAPNGLHFIRLLEVRGGQPNLTKAQARDFVFHQKLEKKIEPWLKELREVAYVKIIN